MIATLFHRCFFACATSGFLHISGHVHNEHDNTVAGSLQSNSLFALI
nr:MAG TPA: hypothetical protein [Caudoviricetes sp.]DAN63478.1 MAG TPA: hypothetical protein [Caudoviricetes sp.]